MSIRSWFLASFLCAITLTAPRAFAQQESHDDDPFAESAPAVTHHQITVDGKVLRYTATAGRLPIKSEKGDTEAAIFFTAYTLEGEAGRLRPVTFAFNGGPGTATAWLHMGALGPRRIKLEREGFVPAPPYTTVENPETILDKTDLVFIDAPGTGFSRVKPEFIGKYYNIPGDVTAFGKFIRLYLTRYQRWHSPLFLFGESYGTTRAAALVNFLIDDAIPVNGVALLSVGLDFATLNPGNLNDLPYVLIVPSYTVIAAYHHKLAPELAADLDSTLKKVEQWCATEYTYALAQGTALPPEQRQKIVAQLAAYTGLKPEVVDENDLRIAAETFRQNLLKDQRLQVGRIDGRFASPRPQSSDTVAGVGFDPSMAAMFPAFNAVMSDYAETDLAYKSETPYKIWDAEGVNRRWEWGPAMQGYPQTATLLQSAMVKNGHVKVLVMEGMYDLATPYYASTYTFRHMHLTPTYLKNLTFANFKAGHMVYNDATAIQEMKRALDAWYQNTMAASK